MLTNTAVEQLIEIEKARGAALKFDDIIEQVAGVYPRVMVEARWTLVPGAAAWWLASSATSRLRANWSTGSWTKPTS